MAIYLILTFAQHPDMPTPRRKAVVDEVRAWIEQMGLPMNRSTFFPLPGRHTEFGQMNPEWQYKVSFTGPDQLQDATHFKLRWSDYL